MQEMPSQKMMPSLNKLTCFSISPPPKRSPPTSGSESAPDWRTFRRAGWSGNTWGVYFRRDSRGGTTGCSEGYPVTSMPRSSSLQTETQYSSSQVGTTYEPHYMIMCVSVRACVRASVRPCLCACVPQRACIIHRRVTIQGASTTPITRTVYGERWRPPTWRTSGACREEWTPPSHTMQTGRRTSSSARITTRWKKYRKR